MNNQREVRFFAHDIEVRNNTESGQMIIEGYAVVFDTPATHCGFTEIIKKGAFDKCDMKDVSLKYNHNDSYLILARTRNGSLKLEIDDKGLKVTANLIDTVSNLDIYKSLQAKLLDKMSFAFSVAENGEEYEEKSNTRIITGINCLYDVSVVDVPFYDTTEIYARSFLKTLDDTKDKENLRARKRLLKRKLEVKIKIENIKGEMKK